LEEVHEMLSKKRGGARPNAMEFGVIEETANVTTVLISPALTATPKGIPFYVNFFNYICEIFLKTLSKLMKGISDSRSI
jgi:hypothetical protein